MTFYIVGAGGFGRETLDALCAASPGAVEPAVFLDDHPQASEIDGIPVRRPEEAEPGVFVVAVADPVARRRLTDALLARAHAPGQVIHPRSVVSARAALGPGCVVLAGAFVSTGTVLGAHVHVNYNATIGHDTVLGDFVTVLPASQRGGHRYGRPGRHSRFERVRAARPANWAGRDSGRRGGCHQGRA